MWSMPDGTRTRSFKKHAKAWHDIYKPIELEFCVSCNGFDPGAQFHGNAPGEFLSLPTWFMIKLAALCQEVKERRALSHPFLAA
jgi:hypothetical protein